MDIILQGLKHQFLYTNQHGKQIVVPNAFALLTGYKDGRANSEAETGKRLDSSGCSQKFLLESALKIHFTMRHPNKVLLYDDTFERSAPEPGLFPVSAVRTVMAEVSSPAARQPEPLVPRKEEPLVDPRLQQRRERMVRKRGISKISSDPKVKITTKTFRRWSQRLNLVEEFEAKGLHLPSTSVDFRDA